MNKVSFLSAISLVFSCQAAIADTTSTYYKSGFYTGIEAGYGDTHYTSAELLSEAQTAFAAQLGGNSTGIFTSGDVNSVGTSGRLFGGYQFTPNFALEMGYIQFNKTDFSGYGHIVNTTGYGSVTDQVYDGELTQKAIDLVAKLTLPLHYGFGVFFKGGVAYVSADRHINFTQDYFDNLSRTHSYTQNTLFTKTYQAVRPTYGAGIDYTIPNTLVDLSLGYSEILGGGGISKASLATLGISVKFG